MERFYTKEFTYIKSMIHTAPSRKSHSAHQSGKTNNLTLLEPQEIAIFRSLNYRMLLLAWTLLSLTLWLIPKVKTAREFNLLIKSFPSSSNWIYISITYIHNILCHERAVISLSPLPKALLRPNSWGCKIRIILCFMLWTPFLTAKSLSRCNYIATCL